MNCKVMGIVNVTPDSFSDGGRFFKPEEAIRRVRNLISEGADVIDLGAESTRPGAQPISWEEEWARLDPVLAGLAGGRETRDMRRAPVLAGANQTIKQSNNPTILSVDTYHPETAERALRAGVKMINCVYAEPAARMMRLCEEYGAELVLPAAAMCGSDGGRETRDARRESSTLNSQPATRLWLDPMIGFGTSREEDLALLRSLPELAKRGRVVVGVSRKRIVRRLSGEHGVGKLLGGSVALALWCAAHGASMVRVHDVKETVEALAAWSALEAQSSPSCRQDQTGLR